MEPMRPVDVGRLDPPEPRWQKWGRRGSTAVAILVGFLLAWADPPYKLWWTVAMGLTIGLCWWAIETLVKRRLRATSAAEEPANRP
jgi:apolipoprotein N-acyltransferase